jgi:hypothetical protein
MYTVELCLCAWSFPLTSRLSLHRSIILLHLMPSIKNGERSRWRGGNADPIIEALTT